MSNSQVSTDLDFFEGEYSVAKAAYDKAKKAADQAKVCRCGKDALNASKIHKLPLDMCYREHWLIALER